MIFGGHHIDHEKIFRKFLEIQLPFATHQSRLASRTRQNRRFASFGLMTIEMDGFRNPSSFYAMPTTDLGLLAELNYFVIFSFFIRSRADIYCASYLSRKPRKLDLRERAFVTAVCLCARCAGVRRRWKRRVIKYIAIIAHGWWRMSNRWYKILQMWAIYLSMCVCLMHACVGLNEKN